MKLKLKDKVMVITGRDKGKKGEIVAVLPKQNKVVIDNINVVKKHQKPNQTHPKGGILSITRPIDISKVKVLDPSTGKPARIGYSINAKGEKERIFKVSKFENKKIKSVAKTAKKDDKQSEDKKK